MDPISALGVASSVVQFIQFGGSLVLKSRQLHQSAEGALPEEVDCNATTQRVSQLAKNLKASLTNLQASQADSTLQALSTDENEQLAEAKAIEQICVKCIDVSDTLLRQLGKLQLQEDGRRRKWKSFRMALKSVWSKDEINNIALQLLGFREELALHLIVSIRQKVLACKSQLDATLSMVDTTSQRTIQTLLDHIGSDLKETRDVLRNTIEQGLEKTQETIVASFQASLVQSVQNSLLDSLSYRTMQDRYEAILDAHCHTFQWIFHGNCCSDLDPSQSWDSFVDWLESGHGIYWIQGKAASGKSTLMKFVLEDPRTVHHLKVWAGSSTLATPSFYFWASGSKEQRSQVGLFRSLLYEILKKQPELMSRVVASQWAHNCLCATRHAPLGWTWNLRELQHAFKLLCDSPGVFKMCIFIDGLDEYDGDHDAIAEYFKSLVLPSHIKICLSSRPLLVFEDAFTKCSGLRLQDLTFGDIQSYVRTELREHRKMLQLAEASPELVAELVDEIVKKANGVFLWVKLVVQSLLRGLGNRDDISDLRARLRELPVELKDLYKHMLGSMDRFYRRQASEIFQLFRIIMSTNSKKTSGIGGTVSILELHLAMTANLHLTMTATSEPMSEDEMAAHRKRMEDLTKSCCAGLLELSSKWTRACGRVTYLHQTVKEFLETQDVIDNQWKICKSSYDPHTLAMMSQIIMAKKGIPSESLVAYGIPQNWADTLALLLNALNFAKGAEEASTSVYVELLDHADKIGNAVMASMRRMQEWRQKGEGHWTKYANNDEKSTLLKAATRVGLRTFVEQKLSANNSKGHWSRKSSLLLFWLPLNSGSLYSVSGAPDFDMLEMLLKHGANPNQLIENGTTPWQKLLSSMHERYQFQGHHSTGFMVEVPSLMPWVQLFKLFFRFGANLDATCTFQHSTHKLDCEGNVTGWEMIAQRHRHSLDNIIHDVFRPVLPNEAAELNRLIKIGREKKQGSRSLNNGSSHKRQYDHYDARAGDQRSWKRRR